MRVELRFVWTIHGGLCVMSPGEKWMLQLSVDSWDILLKVCVFTCCKT